ncbi:MAG TPA: ABC transporter ATP-binding protein [Candidatus Binatia bacterium]|nr:ABC transporter ATP-binding protein [Candidatus Binatia bacterium]
MTDSPLIAENLTRRFGAFTAVDHVSFRVERGEVFGFLGSNGSGKSTTIRMLCGLLAPSEGNARVAGLDIRTQAEHVRSHIGYMSQKVSLYANLTVEENVWFFAGLYGVPTAKVEERKQRLYPLLGLAGLDRAFIRELPGGIKQRVALVCSLLHDPDIVFLDEPTAGVDVVNRQVFWKLIRDLAQEGKTLFVTTHYLDEMEYTDRVGFIDQGKLIGLDTPQGLKIHFVGGYRVRLLHRNPEVVRRAAERLQGGFAVHFTRDGAAFILLPDDSTQSAGRLRRELAAINPELDFTTDLPSLEEVFAGMIRAHQGAAA